MDNEYMFFIYAMSYKDKDKLQQIIFCNTLVINIKNKCKRLQMFTNESKYFVTE